MYSSRGSLVIGNATSTAITLLAGTNGQLLYANNSADAGATWVTPDYATSAQGLLAANALIKSNNLSDLSNTITARNNLGLGNAALANTDIFATSTQGSTADNAVPKSLFTLKGLMIVGTATASTPTGVLVGTDGQLFVANSSATAGVSWVTPDYATGAQGLLAANALIKSNNLSDLSNTIAARNNLGLGTAASNAATDFATSTQGSKADNAVPKSLYSARGAIVIGNATSTAITLIAGTNGQLLYANSSADAGATWVTPNYEVAGAAAAAQAAAIAASQPLDADLSNIAALTTTSYGRSFLTLADAAAARSALSLGTAASNAATDFATSTQGSTADNAVPKSLYSAKGMLIAGTSTGSAPANVAVGTNGQVLVANSSATAGVSWAAAPSGGTTSVSITASETLNNGDYVNVFSDTGLFKVRKASSITAGKEAHGFVLVGGAGGTAVDVFMQGINSAVTSQTPGVVYLGTAGVGTDTAPTASGSFVQRIGVAYSATTVYAIPSIPVVLA